MPELLNRKGKAAEKGTRKGASSRRRTRADGPRGAAGSAPRKRQDGPGRGSDASGPRTRQDAARRGSDGSAPNRRRPVAQSKAFAVADRNRVGRTNAPAGATAPSTTGAPQTSHTDISPRPALLPKGFEPQSPLHATRPEVLAPVGSFAGLKAALSHGADAVYFGCGHLNARSEVVAFSEADLLCIASQVHHAGAHAYLAVNTVIYQDELSTAARLIEQALEAGIDAIILQDTGLAAWVHRLFPEAVLHASTQMTVASPAALRWAAEAGFSRVILPREMSVGDFARMTKLAHSLGVETEVFVHGALCVSVSGQCQMSWLRGGRSANRGACACPCRLSWQMLRDGKSFGEKIPVLSPKDQCGLDIAPELRAAGVDSFKIEGRLRSPHYVATVVRNYRRALAGEQVDHESVELAFNRGGGFTTAFLKGEDGRSFLSGRHAGSYGLALGTVVDVDPRRGWLFFRPESQARAQLNDGDVLAVRHPSTEKELASAPVSQIDDQGGVVRCRGFHPDVLKKLDRGDRVFRMTDARATDEVVQAALPRRPIRFKLEAADDEMSILRLTVSTDVRVDPINGVVTGSAVRPEEEGAPGGKGEGLMQTLTASATCPTDPDRQPLPADRVRQQLTKTGATAYLVESVELDPTTEVCLAVSGLNDLRRRCLESLDARLARPSLDVANRVEEDLRGRDAAAVLRDNYAKAGGKGSAARTDLGLPPVRATYPWYKASDALPDLAVARVALPIEAICELIQSKSQVLADWKTAVPGRALDALLPAGADYAHWTIWEKIVAEAPGIVDAVVSPQAIDSQSWRFATDAKGAGDVAKKVASAVAKCADEGGEGVASADGRVAGLDLAALPEHHADDGAHVLNKLSFVTTAGWPSTTVALSPELSPEQTMDLLNDLDDLYDVPTGAALPTVELLVYGRLRAMYMRHCPVGLRREGCSACRGHRFAISDGKVEHPLVCHPEADCWTSLWQTEAGFRLQPQSLFLAADAVLPRLYRFIFTDESSAQQRALLEEAGLLVQR